MTSLADWLLSEGRSCASMAALQTKFAEQLRAQAPVDRLWFGTKALHPQTAAYLWIWTPERGTVTRELGYALFARMDSVDSPVQRLRKGAPRVRWRRDRDPEPELQDVAALWEQGFTDFFGSSVHFRGEWIGALTWATRAPEGFADSHIALFEQVQPLLSTVIEPLARDSMYSTLLRTYIGQDAGLRVAAGQVRRGDQQHLRAAVWFSDVRGFTRLSQELPRSDLLELLNDIFEEVVEGLEAHGGQVLKFIGDGVLAVFTVRDGADADADACARATQAAADVQRRLDELRARRAAEGRSGARVGIGLHIGDVSYGNIGAPGRLDFTVIGQAVNLSARVEGLCSRLGQSVLATEAFARHLESGWIDAGHHEVKGLSEPVHVYGLELGAADADELDAQRAVVEVQRARGREARAVDASEQEGLAGLVVEREPLARDEGRALDPAQEHVGLGRDEGLCRRARVDGQDHASRSVHKHAGRLVDHDVSEVATLQSCHERPNSGRSAKSRNDTEFLRAEKQQKSRIHAGAAPAGLPGGRGLTVSSLVPSRTVDDDTKSEVEPLSGFSPGRFFELKPAGMGRNAVVLSAWDAHLQRHVVFKRPLTPELLAEHVEVAEQIGLIDALKPHFENLGEHLRKQIDAQERYTTQREGQLLAQISHPNVVPVHDVGMFDDEKDTIILGYLGGGTLDDRDLSEHSWEDVLEILLQIGQGLEAIHAEGILHRDFKPNNIMFDDKGRPVIVDLGLACRLDDEEAMADWVGSLLYMAPEVSRRELRDVRDDVYAFSVVAFQTFYAPEKIPFAKAEHRSTGKIKRPAREAGMSRAVHDVIVRGLAPNPDKRWSDMSTVLRELEAARDRTLAEPERRRWPIAIAWAAAVVVIGLSLSVPEVRASSCDEIAEELDAIWTDDVRADLRDALGTRKAGDAMQDWVSRWVAVRGQECEAARPTWDNPRGGDPGPTPCSASLRDRFTSTIHAFEAPHLREQLAFTTVLAELPAPEYCLDHPDVADWGYGGPIELRDLDVQIEALIKMGDLDVARTRLHEFTAAADEQASKHASTRALFWRGELSRHEGRLENAEQDFSAVYLQAWEIGLPALSAHAMLKLVAIAGERDRADVVNAYALAARGMLGALRPAQTAELMQIQGLGLEDEQGLALLRRAVEMREAELQEHPGTRELLSQAQESHAHGLLDAGYAREAFDLFDVALDTHQDEFGHGTWRTHGILRYQLLATIKEHNWAISDELWKSILAINDGGRDWAIFSEDARWIASMYHDAGKDNFAIDVLVYGRSHAERLGRRDIVETFDTYLSVFEVVMDDQHPSPLGVRH